MSPTMANRTVEAEAAMGEKFRMRQGDPAVIPRLQL
jgi:hypothetical protein